MMTRIPVKDRKEARLIQRGLEDPETRALVLIMGALGPLTERSKKRTLSSVLDAVDEWGQVWSMEGKTP
jgi:hypothetical protein